MRRNEPYKLMYLIDEDEYKRAKNIDVPPADDEPPSPPTQRSVGSTTISSDPSSGATSQWQSQRSLSPPQRAMEQSS